MAGDAGDRGAFFFMATLAESVAVLHAPLLVRREIGVFVADITLIFSLMLGMGEYSGFFACLGLQGDFGRAFVGGCGKSIAGNSKTENKCEGGGTDNGFLHGFSPFRSVELENRGDGPHLTFERYLNKLTC